MRRFLPAFLAAGFLIGAMPLAQAQYVGPDSRPGAGGAKFFGRGGHLTTRNTPAPAITGTGSPVCTAGTVCTDTAGTVTGGTSATSIVITFAVPYLQTPNCVVQWITGPLAAMSYVPSTTAITITQTATTGVKVTYICLAQPGG